MCDTVMAAAGRSLALQCIAKIGNTDKAEDGQTTHVVTKTMCTSHHLCAAKATLHPAQTDADVTWKADMTWPWRVTACAGSPHSWCNEAL